MLNGCDSVYIFKTFSDETRLKTIDFLSYGEMCACDILEKFEIAQPTLPYHMKIITDSGLVNARTDRTWTRYTLNMDLIHSVKIFIETITSDKKHCICQE